MKVKAIITAIGLTLSLTACATEHDKMADAGMKAMPFSGPDSVSYSQDLWKALGSAKLINSPADNPKPYKGVHPHGAVLTTATSEVTIGGHTGKVIVKKNYGGEGVSTDAVAGDPAKYLKAVTVMFEREEGYDPEDQNWFWAKYLPDGSLDKNEKGMQLAGRVAKGKPKGCISCHTAAPGGDMIFTN